MSDARDFFGYKHPDEEPGRREEAADDDAAAPPQFDEAITLDDARVIRGIDASDMVGRVRDLPRQLAQARRVAASVTLPASHREVDAICVLAMGGSAIGAELVEGIAGDRLRVPLVVHRDYGLPAWTSERTLVIAASHSGETVETVSGAGEARRRGLPLVVISTGGALGASAAEDGTPSPGCWRIRTRWGRRSRRSNPCSSGTRHRSRPTPAPPRSWPGPSSGGSRSSTALDGCPPWRIAGRRR